LGCWVIWLGLCRLPSTLLFDADYGQSRLAVEEEQQPFPNIFALLLEQATAVFIPQQVEKVMKHLQAGKRV
jgi:hypothetical protein